MGRVLVTGAAGFIGRHVCAALAEQGQHVIALLRDGSAAHPTAAETYTLDLRNPAAVRAMLRRARPNRVAHLAAVKHAAGDLANFRVSYEENLLATLTLAEAVIDTGGCHRFVWLSSAEEYGTAPAPFDPCAREAPATAYGLSKLAATQLLQALSANYGLPIAVLRATVVYGSDQPPGMFIPSLIRALVAGERFSMTGGDQTRDFVHVDDVVDGIVRALAMTVRHDGALHLSAGAPITVREVALLAARLIGSGAESLIEFGAMPYRNSEAMQYWAPNAETRAVLGWSPRVSLEDGVRRAIAYAQQGVGHA